jgi:hypothetical protein
MMEGNLYALHGFLTSEPDFLKCHRSMALLVHTSSEAFSGHAFFMFGLDVP